MLLKEKIIAGFGCFGCRYEDARHFTSNQKASKSPFAGFTSHIQTYFYEFRQTPGVVPIFTKCHLKDKEGKKTKLGIPYIISLNIHFFNCPSTIVSLGLWTAGQFPNCERGSLKLRMIFRAGQLPPPPRELVMAFVNWGARSLLPTTIIKNRFKTEVPPSPQMIIGSKLSNDNVQQL